MDIKYYQDAADFLAHTGEYLLKDEARYGLITGIARILETHPESFGEEAWFCSVDTGKDINAIAIRTPPRNVLLAYFSGSLETIGEHLVAAVSDKYETIPGITSDKELGNIFTELWCKKHDIKISFTMSQRIHRLDKVNDVPLSPGTFRAATMVDKGLLTEWFEGFRIDIGGEEMNEPEVNFMPALELGWIFLWEDGRPVSMATKSRPTEKGMNVTGVYTPPELRGRGYATSCVAELSRNILQSGKEFCMLYTDLANPASNSIYKKIGYKEVCDSVHHTFKIPA
jgi:ribosomal protein S18 acetylase RimI-like enzyme